MTRESPAPRKERTRQHAIAAQNVNYVEWFIIDEGHTAERSANDYGYDLVLYTYDEGGYAEEGAGHLLLQRHHPAVQRFGHAPRFDLRS